MAARAQAWLEFSAGGMHVALRNEKGPVDHSTGPFYIFGWKS